MFKDKTIVIGVSGGIAVYKVCDLVSRLKKLNARVKVIMTKSATEFVSPLTFQTLSGGKVYTEMFEYLDHWDVEHISIAKSANVFVLAPATANVIGKIRHGIADDMLTTTFMATTAPKVIAPAMNTNMYMNPIVQNNMKTLKEMGYIFAEPDSGYLACGDVGAGRLTDNESIIEKLKEVLNPYKPLKGKTVLVTAGPTQESLDPVRYLTNHSTGKMGYAIARKAVQLGAKVTLISGSVNIEKPAGLDKFIGIKSALEMFEAVKSQLDNNEIVIKSAAVADYRPISVADNKIKKKEGNLNIELERNPDILKYIGQHKGSKILAGFAAETENIIENGKRKLESKNLDFIIINNIKTTDAGFGTDTNIVTILDKNGVQTDYEKMLKDQVAGEILDKIIEIISEG
jgi:phosphopantothenoylcysteine decarboxylase/phosphopantothenate--cysteine ligase